MIVCNKTLHRINAEQAHDTLKSSNPLDFSDSFDNETFQKQEKSIVLSCEHKAFVVDLTHLATSRKGLSEPK